MKYGEMVNGTFEKRLNRFIAKVFIDGQKEKVHIKNTGRLKELLLPGAEILLEYSNSPKRKTKYSLIAVKKDGGWVNIDSQAPNTAVFEALLNGELKEYGNMDMIKREVTYGASRFDLYFEKGKEKGFIEVKGVTLERNGVAMFPDAPTLRGTKHVQGLIETARQGYTAAVLFLIQMKGCKQFTPHKEMDEAFAAAVQRASKEGVQKLAYDCIVKENELLLDQPVPVKLR
jgi:sugar fermentation stimulation protein A